MELYKMGKVFRMDMEQAMRNNGWGDFDDAVRGLESQLVQLRLVGR